MRTEAGAFPFVAKSASRLVRSAAKLLLFAAAFAGISASEQTPASSTANSSAGAGTAAAATLVFEVSSVRRSKAGASGSSTDNQSGHFTAKNEMFKGLVQQAYGIPQLRILGGPKWLETERLDVEAKADSTVVGQLKALNTQQEESAMRGMLQLLLAERFKLIAHWETRELPVYALVSAKSGAKLQPTKGPDDRFGTSWGMGRFEADGLTLPALAEAMSEGLSQELGRVVVDKTGIEGRYDFKLKWTPDAASMGNGAQGDAADIGPSLFTAIQEQLGLKFVSAKGPVKILVIDHAEMPNEN